MLVEDLSQASAARAEGVSVSTRRRWAERAARFAREFNDRVVRGVEPIEIRLDELRGHGRKRDDSLFLFAAIDVSPRLRIASAVGRRTRRSCRLILRETRVRCAAAGKRALIVTDPCRFCVPEIQKTWSRTCVHVESGKPIRNNSIVRVNHDLVWGAPAQLKDVRARCEESKRLDTSFLERLNLTLRRLLSCLHRRTNSAVRDARTLAQRVYLLQCYYNFARSHNSFRFGRAVRTPAHQPALAKTGLRLRDIFLAFRPWSRVLWIVNERVRTAWRARVTCLANNS